MKIIVYIYNIYNIYTVYEKLYHFLTQPTRLSLKESLHPLRFGDSEIWCSAMFAEERH